MTSRLALTREISPALERCELTHLERQPIDLGRARRQHDAYERALEAAGCRVVRLPSDDQMPDSVFIEDTAVVFDEFAVITRPGAESRLRETRTVAEVLAPLRTLRRIEPPGTLDGGDVMVAGRSVFIGRSGRTNSEGIQQFQAYAEPHGYRVVPVDVAGCLHLKSAVTPVSDHRLLINPGWLASSAFPDYDCLEVHPEEPGGANALRIGSRVLYPSGFPRTAERLRALGLDVVCVDADELAKAEGALTCCSLILSVPKT